jgi:iron complex outermembrane recepter protein
VYVKSFYRGCLHVSALFLLTCGPATVFAEEFGEPLSLPEVIVKDKQVLLSDDVNSDYSVNLDQIQKPAAPDSAAQVAKSPGVAIMRNGPSTPLIQMRGLNNNRVKILIDGMTIDRTHPNNFSPPLSFISSAELGSLDVITGVTPVSKGGDSIAGTIIAESKAPHFGTDQAPELFGESGISFSSGNDGLLMNLRTGVANKYLSLTYSGEGNTGNDFEFPGGTVRDTSYLHRNHKLTLAGKLYNTVAAFDVSTQGTRNTGVPTMPVDVIRADADRLSLSVKGAYAFGNVDLKLYWHRNEEYVDNYSLRPVAASVNPTRFFAPGVRYEKGIRLAVELPVQENIVRVGTEYLASNWDIYQQRPAGFAGAGEHLDLFRGSTRNRFGFFAEMERTLGKKWSFLLGTRLDVVSMDTPNIGAKGWYLTPAGMASKFAADAAAFNSRSHDRTDYDVDVTAITRFKATDMATVELGLARKTRAPDLVERYLWTEIGANGGIGDGRTYFGNLDLKPEVSYQVNVGFDLHNDAWQVKPNAFYNYVFDYIQGMPMSRKDSSGKALLQYSNVDAELYGFDLMWNYRLNKDWELDGTVSYVLGSNKTNGDNLYRIAPLHGSINSEYAIWKLKIRGECLLYRMQDNVASYNGETQSPGYVLFNARTTLDATKNVKFTLGVENILDKQYADHLSGVNQVSGGDVSVNSRVPGAGRFVYVALQVAFP